MIAINRIDVATAEQNQQSLGNCWVEYESKCWTVKKEQKRMILHRLTEKGRPLLSFR